jgi:hypothetical protein
VWERKNVSMIDIDIDAEFERMERREREEVHGCRA